MSIAVFVEVRDGAARKFSLEALSEARRQADARGQKVTAVMVGSKLDEAIGKVAGCRPDKILSADDPVFAAYSPESYSAALAAAIRKENSEVVLLPASAMGREVGARTAAKFSTSVLSDVTTLDWGADGVKAVRPVYSGKVIAQVESRGKTPAFVSLRPNVFVLAQPDPSCRPPVEKLEAGVTPASIRGRVTETRKTVSETVELTEADVVVSAGRGLKGPEHLGLVKELAKVLGGAMGASRAIVDAGWIDHQFQVGQTGKVVSPTLYIACGISGAIQHLAGMSSSKYIVAINKDPEAPIFKVADFGIVGDVFQILPPLTEEIRKLRSE
jgi:electron transfer flavoprotein alpha subunit